MADFAPIFSVLSAILRKHSKGMSIKTDSPGNLYIERSMPDSRGKPRFFGAVQEKKSYVSFHLMPVYEHPEMLKEVPEALLKRMQGKSCFNFKSIDELTLAQLDKLTAKAAKTN